MEIKSEVRGSYSGQLDQTLYVDQGGERIAYLDFSEFRGEVAVQMLHVNADHRRNGLGAALLRHLQSLYPSTEIDLGMLTNDGSRLISSLHFATVIDPDLDRQFKLQARIKEKIASLEALPKDEIMQHYSLMNRLYDMERDLEDRLHDRRAEKRLIEHGLPRFGAAALYNSMDFEHAITALANNEMKATASQRFWSDGRRRKEDWEGYQESYWMKGISFTRDVRYALNWKDVVFAIDQTKLRQRVRLVPFAWNYHFGASTSAGKPIDHKREREEYAIFKRTRDTYERSEEDGGGFDTNRFVEPEGGLKPLDQFLLGILVRKGVVDIYGEDKLRPVLDHPKFMGIIDTKQLR